MKEESVIEVRDILDHFRHIPSELITDDALTEYCTRMGFAPIDAGVYSDWKAQEKYDTIMEALLPAVLAIIGKMHYVPELIGAERKKELTAENEHLATEVCKLLEDHEVEYKFVNITCDNIASDLKQVVEGAKIRANNMASTMFSFIAIEKLGAPLTVKKLGEAYREAAIELGKKQGLK